MKLAVGIGLVILGASILITGEYLFPVSIHKLAAAETVSFSDSESVNWELHSSVAMILIGLIILMLSIKELRMNIIEGRDGD